MIKILINKCNEIYRKKKIKTVPMDDIDTYRIIDNNGLEMNSKLNFYSIINCLNDKEKLIMILYYGQNYTTKEIGKILGKSDNTIKTILRRGRIKIKEKHEDLLGFNI